MYLQVCQHPIRLKINGYYRYLPCGKCNVCINRKSSMWITRIEQEFRCHPFAFFVTLTYDNDNVPKVYLDNTSDSSLRLVNPITGEYFDLDEIKGFRPSSRLYVQKRKNIPYLRFKDMQDFIKLLRFYIANLTFNTQEHDQSRALRYVYCGEYGPTTFRPHYHAIFFVDSSEVARQFRELVNKCWRFGITDIKSCNASTGKYIARYINGLSALPLVYHHRSLRPRLVASKFPPIGSLSASSFVEEQLFYGGYKELQIMDSAGKVQDVPVFKYLENKLFPKIQGFVNFSHSCRVALYGIASYFPSDDFAGFCQGVEAFITKYISEKSDFKASSFEDLHSDPTLFDYLYLLLYNDSKHNYMVNYNALKSLYYTSVRVLSQRRIFGVSLDFYVSRIEDYYSSKELQKLSRFYEFQESLSIREDSRLALFYLYDSALDYLQNYLVGDYDVSVLPFEYRRLFADLGFDLNNPLAFSAAFARAQRFQWLDNERMSQLADKIVNQSRKTKKRNDYILAVQKDYNFNLLKEYD